MASHSGIRSAQPGIGQFVSLRGRLWMVEAQPDGPFDGHRLACIDDDASGEDARILWSAEVDARLHDEEAWASLGREGGTGGGDAASFSAYLRTVRWRTATAAERDLFQAPFRAGIRLDPYQLLPLRKALRLPRVNLLIADDVGLGKTVEAGLVLRELLLRRRVDFTVVLAPAAMTTQWRDELQSKFGLAFEIIDARHLEALRRRRGYGANPWAAGSRFILSHRLLGDEAYVAGLRDVLEDFRARSLLILDEAHHAAPAGGGRYAIESQFTRGLRDLSDRFEHRLFLSATPHNGHPNSFATLLELLDPQRFTRGVAVRPADLEPVMVRRLKSDLRALGERFPERVVDAIVIDDLPDDAPELVLAAMLADYRHLREARIATLPPARRAQARLGFVGLQQRLLSSIPAFARTLKVHIDGLDRAIAGAAATTIADEIEPDAPDLAAQEDAALDLLTRGQDARIEAEALAGTRDATPARLAAERAHAAAMLALADDREPAARGFEHSFALLQGLSNHFGADQNAAWTNAGLNPSYRDDGRPATLPAGSYSTDYFTDRLIGYLDQARRAGDARPFFAYLPFTAPHWPLQAPPETIAKYKGRYDAGYEALRDARLARQKQLGLVPADAVAHATEQVRPWASLSPDERAIEACKMEVYAVMVDRLDQNVGRVIAALKAQGRYDNTIILFLSDNGPEGNAIEAPSPRFRIADPKAPRPTPTHRPPRSASTTVSAISGRRPAMLAMARAGHRPIPRHHGW